MIPASQSDAATSQPEDGGEEDDDGQPDEPDDGPPVELPPVLALFDPIYMAMSRLGWSDFETGEMEAWQVARKLGIGGRKPVVRGARMLSIPGDDDGGEEGTAPGPGGTPKLSDARIAEARAEYEARLKAQHVQSDTNGD